MLTRHSPLHALKPCRSGVVPGESQFSGRSSDRFGFPNPKSRVSTKKMSAGPSLSRSRNRERTPRFRRSSETEGATPAFLLRRMQGHSKNQSQRTSKQDGAAARTNVEPAADGV